MSVEYELYVVLGKNDPPEEIREFRLSEPILVSDRSLPARGDIIVNYIRDPAVMGASREYFEVIDIERVFEESAIPLDRSQPIVISQVPRAIVQHLEKWPELTTLERLRR